MAINIVRRIRGERFTGANESAFLAEFGGTFVSKVGGVLSFVMNGDPFTINTDQWFAWASDGTANQSFGTFDDEPLFLQWAEYATSANLSDLASRVSALESAQDTAQSQLAALEALGVRWSHGTAALAAGLVTAGTRSFSITLDEPVDQSVAPVLLVQGAQLVGGHLVASWSYSDSTTITGTYSSLALASAATLHAYVPYLG